MTILNEKHKELCTCSYCGNSYDKGLHIGLNVPKSKSWNSWWVIKYGNKKYFRWTFSFLKRWEKRNENKK